MNLNFSSVYRTLSVLRWVSALLTALTFLWIQVAPDKALVLHPNPYTSVHAYADSVEAGGNSKAQWLDRDSYTFECDIQEGIDWRYCGVSLKFYKDPLKDTIVTWNEDYAYGILRSYDLSEFKALHFDIEYEGSENQLRIFMRNAFHMPETFADHNRQKFINEVVSKNEMHKTVVISLNEFSVADWWATQFKMPRQEGVATFDKIFEIGVDFSGQPPLGKHRFSVRKISAVGDYTQKESFYFFIIVFWLCFGTVEAIFQLTRLLRHQKHMAHENSHLREEARTDALTGLANRHGAQSFIDEQFPATAESDCYLLILDLDHFKKINDTFGHDIGDDALGTAAKAFKRALRETDLVARWGGEEFLVITTTPDKSLQDLVARLMRELTTSVMQTPFGDLTMTVSIGVAKAKAGEPFDATFKRADQMVYAAKMAGRNTWRLATT